MTRLITGNDWEDEIVALLMRRYSPGDFLQVPADDEGDLGMDGVGRDGVVYQCYSPAGEPLTNKIRLEKHQGKVYSDLLKLTNKADEHRAFLGDIVVKRWMLVVPVHSSRKIQEYANKRAAEVIKFAQENSIEYISSDFSATVCDDAFLAAERKAMINGVRHQLNLQLEEIDSDDVESWAKSHDNSEFIDNLVRKLKKLNLDETKGVIPFEDLLKNYLRRYITGQDLMQRLADNHPEIYEVVINTKGGFELLLESRSELSQTPGHDRILEELSAYKTSLDNSVNNDLGARNVNELCHEAISDWLMKCHLDFPNNESN